MPFSPSSPARGYAVLASALRADLTAALGMSFEIGQTRPDETGEFHDRFRDKKDRRRGADAQFIDLESITSTILS
jgi:hypothetical protein